MTFFAVLVLGEPVPRSLEGLFVYEERSTSPPANDTIVVEQWTVIEVSGASVCVRESLGMPYRNCAWPHSAESHMM